MKRIVLLSLLGWLGWAAGSQAAKPSTFLQKVFSKGEKHRMTRAEQQSYLLFQRGDLIRTRSLCDKYLKQKKDSYICHFFMSHIYYYSEGQLLSALWHLRQARKYYSFVSTRTKSYTNMVFLYEEIQLIRQLGFHRKTLKLLKEYELLYPFDSLDPLKPWSYMKLGQYKKAIALATKLLKTKHRVAALNALCATYYEMGSRSRHLKYCMEALKLDSKKKTRIGTDLATHNYNVSEAWMSMIRFQKAEKYALSGTKHFHAYTYSNPWQLLVGLYLEEGRLNDAWNALKESQRWFLRQEPLLAESVFAGVQVTKAMFFLSLGKAKLALGVLEKIRDRPDRRGHSSSRMEQQLATMRLIRRHGLRLRVQELLEEMPAQGFWKRWRTRWTITKLRMDAWKQGASVRKLLMRKSFLQKVFSPFRSGSISLPNSTLPYWMSVDLVPLLGPAVVRQQLARLRKQEGKGKSPIKPFLNAIEAYACYVQGQEKDSLAFTGKALKSLPPRFLPLRLALNLWGGHLLWKQGKYKKSRQRYRLLIRKDGSMFRRFQLALPVLPRLQNDATQKALLASLLASPRFVAHRKGLILQLRKLGSALAVQLNGRDGTVLTLLRLQRKAGEKRASFVRRAHRVIHQEFFAPRFALARKNTFSLDSSLSTHSQRRTSWKKLLQQLKPTR